MGDHAGILGAVVFSFSNEALQGRLRMQKKENRKKSRKIARAREDLSFVICEREKVTEKEKNLTETFGTQALLSSQLTHSLSLSHSLTHSPTHPLTHFITTHSHIASSSSQTAHILFVSCHSIILHRHLSCFEVVPELRGQKNGRVHFRKGVLSC